MKKCIAYIMTAIMMIGVLSACSSQAEEVSVETSQADTMEQTVLAKEIEDASDVTTLNIVTTIFPEYDWVKEILGENADNAEVTMLLDSGIDLHSFQPTAEDILKISNCDMFIYVGGESDEWVEDALEEAVNKDMVVINLLEVLGENAKEEEIVEGMEGEDEEDGAEEEEEEIEYDEHVWLSLKNAVVFCEEIETGLEQLDPENATLYQENLATYVEKLNELDEKYQAVVDEAEVDTLLFGDRFPFRYLVDDYGLNYYAAFVGCSAETEASFETIIFLAEKLNELELKSIMIIESSDGSIAEAIRNNSQDKDQEILVLNSLQSTTMEDVTNGATYLTVMEDNLEILEKALN